MATYNHVKFTKGSNIVYIAVKLVEENILNPVKVITTPTDGDAPSGSKILNLNRVEDRFTITGSLVYGKLDETETKTSAKDKKDLLKVMFAKGSVVVFNYEDTDYDVAIDKFNIKDKSADNTDSVDGEVVYDLIISCVTGEDIINNG